MSVSVPEAYRDLLDGPVFVTLVTIMPSGQPQATPVWCSYDGTRVWVNTTRGRQKDRNMQRDGRVTILAIDPKNPYRRMEIRGKVDEITEEGALDHINQLSKVYRGWEDYYLKMPQLRGKETRVIYKIKPTKVNVRG